jgi:hypothetical protein
MSFADQVKAFADKAKAALDAKQKEVELNGKKVLQDLLGDEVSKIQSIRLDTDCGKFYDVVAPESIIAKLRAAGLMKP